MNWIQFESQSNHQNYIIRKVKIFTPLNGIIFYTVAASLSSGPSKLDGPIGPSDLAAPSGSIGANTLQ